MKAQRLKIVEGGWENYSDYFGGFKFTNGLSDDPISHSDAQRLGSWIRVEGVDDDRQVGEGVVQTDIVTKKAEVVVAAGDKTPETVGAGENIAAKQMTRYTREELEGIADQGGIGAVREVADKLGVKGRGINELIREILQKQG